MQGFFARVGQLAFVLGIAATLALLTARWGGPAAGGPGGGLPGAATGCGGAIVSAMSGWEVREVTRCGEVVRTLVRPGRPQTDQK